MLTLLVKDFKLMFAKDESAAKRALGILLRVLVLGIVVAVELFLFTAILDKIGHYSKAPRAFMVLFLLVVTAFMTVSSIFQAKKLFFNERDINQLSIHPITNSMQVLSKLVLLFLVHYASSFIFVFPLFAAYGIMYGRSMMFYYMALFYPAASFVFEVGIALVFVYPVWYILEYLRKHVLLEFSLSVALLYGLAWIYSTVLGAFTGLVSNNEVSTLLSSESIESLVEIERYTVPLNYLFDVFIDGRRGEIFNYLTFSGAIFIIGLTLTIITFHRVRNISSSSKLHPPKVKYKLRSQSHALIKKELALITRNPDFIFSYSGLLIVQPFLLYLVIGAMNAVFSSGTLLYYTSLFPNFVSVVDVFIVMMFTTIISAGANQYVSMEERTVKNLKTIPVSYKRQLYVKMLIPMALSTASLLISVLVLLISGVFTPLTALFAFVLSLTLLFVFNVVSLSEELKIRRNKPRSSGASSACAYLLPTAYMGVSLVLSYLGTELWLLFTAGIALFVLLGAPIMMRVNRKMGDWFMELEAIN
ncbi:MAG: hypothetical protein IJY69_02735 [Clostridia bacterium]|nr:hypothetical protein [Clostridia bacterium]